MAVPWPAPGAAIAAYSYGAAAVAFLLVFLLLLSGWRQRAHVAALDWACALTAAWAAYAAWRGAPAGGAGPLLELLRTGAWLACLLLLLEGAWRPARRALLLAGAALLRLVAGTVAEWAGLDAGDACCRFLQQRRWVVDVPECRQHPQRYDGLRLPDWLQALPDAWLLVPMMLHGRLFGFVCLARLRGCCVTAAMR